MDKWKLFWKHKAGTSMSIACFLLAVSSIFAGTMNAIVAFVVLSTMDKEGKDSTFHKMAKVAVIVALVTAIVRIVLKARGILLQGGSLLGSDMMGFLPHLFFG